MEANKLQLDSDVKEYETTLTSICTEMNLDLSSVLVEYRGRFPFRKIRRSYELLEDVVKLKTKRIVNIKFKYFVCPDSITAGLDYSFLVRLVNPKIKNKHKEIDSIENLNVRKLSNKTEILFVDHSIDGTSFLKTLKKTRSRVKIEFVLSTEFTTDGVPNEKVIFSNYFNK